MSGSDRVMPHNLDAERSILGAILIDNEAYEVVAGVIEPAIFYRDAHRTIYRHIVALANGNVGIDLVTLCESLRRTSESDDVGGDAYVASLTDGVPKATNVAYYARIVREKWQLREFIIRLDRRIKTAYEWHEPPDELLQSAASDVGVLVAKAATPNVDPFVTARDTCQAQHDVSLILAPYVAAGSTIQIVAKIKEGKTSVLLEMVRCMCRRQSFCGFAVPDTSTRIIYGTEQGPASFTVQLTNAGLQDEDGLIVTYLASWLGRSWPEIAKALIARAITESAQVIILDTDSRWFGFKDDDENKAGGAAYVEQFGPFIAQGGTVILSRHGRKSGGTASDAGRGSSAIGGAADVILHLKKPTGQPPEVRDLEYVGRFEMPDQLLIRRRPNFQHHHPYVISGGEVVSPRYVFEAAQVANSDSPRSLIRAVLLTGAKTIAQIVNETTLSSSTITRAFKEMGGEVIKMGKAGPRKNAVLYGLATSSLQSLRSGDVEVAGKGAA